MEACKNDFNAVALRNCISDVQRTCERHVDSREIALVNTKLEEAVFWCEKYCVEVLGIPVQELMLNTECCDTGGCDTAA